MDCIALGQPGVRTTHKLTRPHSILGDQHDIDRAKHGGVDAM